MATTHKILIGIGNFLMASFGDLGQHTKKVTVTRIHKWRFQDLKRIFGWRFDYKVITNVLSSFFGPLSNPQAKTINSKSNVADVLVTWKRHGSRSLPVLNLDSIEASSFWEVKTENKQTYIFSPSFSEAKVNVLILGSKPKHPRLFHFSVFCFIGSLWPLRYVLSDI